MKTFDYVVCYDISCPKRLAKVARVLERVASRIQKSIFLFDKVTTKELELLQKKLESIIDHDADDIRIYKVDVKRSFQAFSGIDLSNPYLLI